MALLEHAHFDGTRPDTGLCVHLGQLYGVRSGELWKRDNILYWLYKSVCRVLEESGEVKLREAQAEMLGMFGPSSPARK